MFEYLAKKKINDDLVTYICLLIFPSAFLVGPVALEICIFFICFFFIKFCIKSKIFRLFNKKLFKIYIAFLIFAILSSLINAENKFLSVFKSFAHIRFIIFFFAIKNFLDNNNNKIKYLYISILIPLSFAGITGWVDYFDGNKIIYNSRVSGIFKDELIMGTYIFSFFFILLSIKSIFKIKFKIDYIVFLFLYLTIILSNERMVIIKLLFFTLVILAYYICFKNFKKGITSLLIVLTILFLFFKYNPDKIHSFQKYKNYIERIYNEEFLKIKFKDDENLSVLSYDYVDLFKTGFLSAKIYFPMGIGVRNFRNICNNNELKEFEFVKCSTHPHNLYIEIFAETGFIGFVIFGLFLIFIILSILRNEKISKFDKLLLLASFFTFFWPFSTTGGFFNNFYSSLIWYNLAFIKYFCNLKVKY